MSVETYATSYGVFEGRLNYDTPSEFTYPATITVVPDLFALLTNSGGYSTANPAITSLIGITATYLSNFSYAVSAGGGDALKYQLIASGQAYWWNGTSWTVSDSTYTQANDANDIDSHASQFFLNLGLPGRAFIQVRAFLHSADGTTTPSITSVSLYYENSRIPVIPASTDGVSLETMGLVWNPAVYATSGLGLETFGFVDLANDNWAPSFVIPQTSWTAITEPPPTTIWTDN